MIDPLTRLSELPSAEPTPERAARVRMRLRAELARQAPRAAPGTAPSGGLARAPLWHTAVAVLCVAYVAEAVVLAVDVLRSR